MEDELISLKMEMRRYVSESRQIESQLLANRRVIGMLLNRLQQSLGACHQVFKSVDKFWTRVSVSRRLETMVVFRVERLDPAATANATVLQARWSL